MATFGAIRRQVTQALALAGHTTVHADLIDDAINQRYTAILDRLAWRRQRVEAVLALVAPYKTGTLAATAGQTAITGTDTVWTAAMTGRRIRIAGRNEWYTFTRTGDTTGTLDRAYEGDTGTGLSYSIFQNVYTLPADCRVLEGLASFDLGPLEYKSKAEFDELAGARAAEGTPLAYRRFMDDSSSPPQMRVELSPVPDAAIGLPYSYFADEAQFGATDTAVSLLPWMRPAALVEGALADVLGYDPEALAAAAAHETKFERAAAQMERTEIQNQPVQRLRLPSRFTRHRADRAVGRRRLLD